MAPGRPCDSNRAVNSTSPAFVGDATRRGIGHLQRRPDDIGVERRIGGPRSRMPGTEQIVGVAAREGRVPGPHHVLGRRRLPLADVQRSAADVVANAAAARARPAEWVRRHEPDHALKRRWRIGRIIARPFRPYPLGLLLCPRIPARRHGEATVVAAHRPTRGLRQVGQRAGVDVPPRKEHSPPRAGSRRWHRSATFTRRHRWASDGLSTAPAYPEGFEQVMGPTS